jgi:hypothetical protein
LRSLRRDVGWRGIGIEFLIELFLITVITFAIIATSVALCDRTETTPTPMRTTTTLHVGTAIHPLHAMATTRASFVAICLEHRNLVILCRGIARLSIMSDLLTAGTYSNVTLWTRKAGSSR